MKILHTKKQFFVFYMLGFLLGILYANLAVSAHLVMQGIFSDYFLKQYNTTAIVPEEYMWYLLQVRLLPFATIFGLGLTRYRRISAAAFLLWTGFTSGVLISMAIMNMGIKGIILCVVGILPQFLLYIPAYLVLLWHNYSYPSAHWSTQKSIFVILCLLVGIILEGYVNPQLMGSFLKTL